MDAGRSSGPGQSSFAQGFVVGQLVLIVALVFLFRYLYVADLPTTLEQERRALIARTEAVQRSLEAKLRGRAPPPDSEFVRRGLQDVLQKTQYEMGAHAPETLDWLNVILAQMIARYRDAIVGYAPAGAAPADPESGMPSLQNAEKAAAKRLAEHMLNTAVAGRTMNMLDKITVTDIDFGTQYPKLTHARVRPSESPDVARLEVDFDYTDQISFGIDTKLLMNFPQLRFGSLALGLCLRVQQLCGTVRSINTLDSTNSAARRGDLHAAPGARRAAAGAAPGMCVPRLCARRTRLEHLWVQAEAARRAQDRRDPRHPHAHVHPGAACVAALLGHSAAIAAHGGHLERAEHLGGECLENLGTLVGAEPEEHFPDRLALGVAHRAQPATESTTTECTGDIPNDVASNRPRDHSRILPDRHALLHFRPQHLLPHIGKHALRLRLRLRIAAPPEPPEKVGARVLLGIGALGLVQRGALSRPIVLRSPGPVGQDIVCGQR